MLSICQKITYSESSQPKKVNSFSQTNRKPYQKNLNTYQIKDLKKLSKSAKQPRAKPETEILHFNL